MTQRERQIIIIKELIALFCMLATVGAAFNGQFLAATGYFTIFLAIVYEKKIETMIRRWLRHRRY